MSGIKKLVTCLVYDVLLRKRVADCCDFSNPEIYKVFGIVPARVYKSTAEQNFPMGSTTMSITRQVETRKKRGLNSMQCILCRFARVPTGVESAKEALHVLASCYALGLQRWLL